MIFFFNDTATTEIYPLSLHDALPILLHSGPASAGAVLMGTKTRFMDLPAGRVQLFNQQNFNTREVPQVQIALTPEASPDN